MAITGVQVLQVIGFANVTFQSGPDLSYSGEVMSGFKIVEGVVVMTLTPKVGNQDSEFSLTQLTSMAASLPTFPPNPSGEVIIIVPDSPPKIFVTGCLNVHSSTKHTIQVEMNTPFTLNQKPD